MIRLHLSSPNFPLLSLLPYFRVAFPLYPCPPTLRTLFPLQHRPISITLLATIFLPRTSVLPPLPRPPPIIFYLTLPSSPSISIQVRPHPPLLLQLTHSSPSPTFYYLLHYCSTATAPPLTSTTFIPQARPSTPCPPPFANSLPLLSPHIVFTITPLLPPSPALPLLRASRPLPHLRTSTTPPSPSPPLSASATCPPFPPLTNCLPFCLSCPYPLLYSPPAISFRPTLLRYPLFPSSPGFPEPTNIPSAFAGDCLSIP